MNEIRQRRSFNSFPYLFLGGIRGTIHDVVANRIVKQNHVLRNNGDVTTKRFKRQILSINTINQNAAFGRIPEPRNHMNQSTFARTGQPDQSNTIASFQFKIKVVYSITIGIRIAQRHVIENKITTAFFQLNRPLVFLIFVIENAEDAFCSHSHHDKASINPGKIAKRRHQKEQGRQEGHKVTHCDQTLTDLEHCKAQHNRNTRHEN